MDKGAIERFAISARNKLRHSVNLRMTELGANPSHPVKVDVVGNYVVLTDQSNGLETRLTSEEDRARNQLLAAISQNGYDNVIESVAYTWFNRLIAIRYMEVNNYLPTHVRVLSSITPGKKEPDLVTQCLSVKFDYSDSEKERISRLQTDGDSDGLFKLMFLIQCRELNKILPELFTRTKVYENMLCDLSYTNPDGVVRDFVDNIPEEDFKDAVQIIGWMYQYYNTELKDDTFAKLKKNVKISKERIPSATQLFTPDWIVRYMVENSVGRTWLDGHPDDNLKSNWKYFLDEAQQTPEVEAELSKLRKEKADMSPEDITVIDPCMGSGHILVYAFDVLIQIYESYGYSKEDAAVKIVEKNLYGLDIDDRAYQLAYFAVMMKARQYNSRIFDNPVKNHIFALVESDIITEEVFTGFGNNMSAKDKTKALSEIDYLVRTFRNAKTYGSLIKVREVDWTLIESFLKDHGPTLSYTADVSERLSTIVSTAKCLSHQYSSVLTNPPYMNSSGMNESLLRYVKDNYSIGKSDLFACFIERCISLTKPNEYLSMITQHAFMFLSSFEELRKNLSDNGHFTNMAHLGPRAFDEINGEVVQSTAFVYQANKCPNYNSIYLRLVNGMTEKEKESMFFRGDLRFIKSSLNLMVLPGRIISYWMSNNLIDAFNKGMPLSEIASPRQGLATGENARFVRQWYEVDINNVKFDCKSRSESMQSGKKWFPYNKGGEYRKWYGNNDTVVNWEHDGEGIRNFTDEKGKLRSRPQNMDYYFRPAVTWSKISSGAIAFRYKPSGHIFDVAGTSIFAPEDKRRYIHGFCNSIVALTIANAISPTLNYEVGHIASFPVIFNDERKNNIDNLVEDNIRISKKEWDSYEVSWDFQTNPLVSRRDCKKIELAINTYVSERKEDFQKVKNNEESLNEAFIQIYGLSDELSNTVDDDRITIRIPTAKGEIINLISYSVGCMFGRYSLDTPGLCYASGVWDSSKYSSFIPDSDNIIPINDEEYFGDDIVTYFERFIETVFGKETLEENLKYIANVLEIKGSGTAREKIRKYFLNDFYKDHLQMYQKCPIYWLFDSGKANGFKALAYMHRYTPDLIGKMRQNYLLKMQRIYGDQVCKENDQVKRTAIQKKLDEIGRYDLAVELYASKNVEIDLDDGVKHNYALFQDIENSRSAKDKINLLYKI
ncbi:BREX-1 system adenine-specific DNA-methyltransferase PglX [Methanomethylophilus alvi]|uniref:BREX-1 system adenine-specific DNA-methyltransferase PglX n=1 Tax=Methanomethylophilus alvi TaxID=1291540 RepID=UPI0037DC682E